MRIIFSTLFMFILYFAFAGLNINEFNKATQYLQERGEVYILIENSNKVSIDFLAKIVSIDKVNDSGIYFYANIFEFEKFTGLNIDYKVLTPPSLEQLSLINKLKTTDDKIFGKYPGYEEYITLMDSFTTNNSSICKLVEIGESVKGRKLLFVKISDNVDIREPEPEFMYSSSIHGDELTGFMLMLKLIDYLLSGYSSNIQVQELINNTEIWINPLANPDGTYFLSESSVSGAKRYNANNIDLNRNFPDPDDGPHPDGNSYQPEVIAMMDFMKDHRFVLSANLHGGAEVINYPWDTWEKLHPDDLWFQYVSRKYADTVHSYSNNYMIGFENGITNGYAWYTITGGRQDFITYFLN
ncbi:MAG: zinc carboxypeptidase, partial [Bacteroidales bacterium]|nr:zinc carboxypeptidase [Bacteroidales bacterium]